MTKKLLLLFILLSTSLFAQVKIGNNPSQININSLLELESSEKVFVLNRLTSVEMNNIQPLHGALVYNTDEKCIFLYEGTYWKNLCEFNNNDFITSISSQSESKRVCFSNDTPPGKYRFY